MTSEDRSTPAQPLGRIPYLPPIAWCDDHLGDRNAGPMCPNCRPLTELEKVTHRAKFEREHGYS